MPPRLTTQLAQIKMYHPRPLRTSHWKQTRNEEQGAPLTMANFNHDKQVKFKLCWIWGSHSDCLWRAITSDISPRSPVKGNRYFGKAYRLHLQGRWARQVRNQHETGSKHKPHTAFLLGLLIDHEDGCDMFFRNVRWL
jgi:hypothetical protein